MNHGLFALAGLLLVSAAALAQTISPAPEEIPESITPQMPASDAPDEDDEDNNDGRIVGGERAPTGAVPWQIEIFSTNAKYLPEEIEADKKLPRGHKDKLYLGERQAHELAHKCGGSYIGQGWILTAAHCVPAAMIDLPGGKKASLFAERRIRMGTQVLTAGGETFAMERVVVHAGYNDASKVHDIALIKIRDAGQIARLGSRLKAIPLHSPKKPIFLNEDLWVTGWGWMAPRKPRDGAQAATAARLGVGDVTQRNPADLQQARLKHVGDAHCKPHYPNWGKGMLCVGSGGTGRDSCQGDSGGPLVRQEGSRKILVGIVSNGYGCAFKDIPGAYTRVSHYLGWIAAQQKSAPLGFSRR